MFDSAATIVDETPRPGVPDNTLAVRKGLDRALTEKLKSTLLGMNSDPQGKAILARFGAARFIATSDSDFKSLYKLVNRLHIDLHSYPYRKEMMSSPSRSKKETK